jgi:hypothetical protein
MQATIWLKASLRHPPSNARTHTVDDTKNGYFLTPGSLHLSASSLALPSFPLRRVPTPRGLSREAGPSFATFQLRIPIGQQAGRISQSFLFPHFVHSTKRKGKCPILVSLTLFKASASSSSPKVLKESGQVTADICGQVMQKSWDLTLIAGSGITFLENGCTVNFQAS